MSLRTLSSFLLFLPLMACGSDSSDEPVAESTGSGDEVVVDPVGNPTVHDPAHPEPYDELAESLSAHGDRVDYGERFARDAIEGRPGQRLVFNGAILETWSFADPAGAMEFAQRFSDDGRLFDDDRLPWTETTHLWVSGPMVVMYIGDDREPMTAMNAVGTRVTTHASSDDMPSEREVEERVRESAFERYQFGGQTELELVAAERVTFANACLETPGVAEVCTEVQTPGWKMTFAHGDDRFVAHVDQPAARIFWQDRPDG